MKPGSMDRPMILPGLISVAFYRRRPTALQTGLGLAITIGLSGLLGFWQDYGTSRVWVNTALAIAGGLVLYFAILAYLTFRYFPRQERIAATSTSPPAFLAGRPLIPKRGPDERR